MFYNLENLYDTVDDTLRRDEEFQPEGDRHWSGYRFYHKLTSIAKVILNTGAWEPPAVIGFCEVENREVLEQLVGHPLLRRWNYQIVHKDSPDKRGIDVAAIYRPDGFYPLSYRYLPPVPEGEQVPSTREILYLCGICGGQGEEARTKELLPEHTVEAGHTKELLPEPSVEAGHTRELLPERSVEAGRTKGLLSEQSVEAVHTKGLLSEHMVEAARTQTDIDTLHLFFNHWPTRYGGLMETRPLRMKAARRLKTETRILQQKHHHPLIIITGDFNDQPQDESLLRGMGAAASSHGHPDSLVNLSYPWKKTGKGTLKYQSQWNIFDQFIVSEALLEAMPVSARILEASFLLEEDEKFTGTRLRRTYLGFRYQGGFSDHLPVLLHLGNTSPTLPSDKK